jgi:hypothetical protein
MKDEREEDRTGVLFRFFGAAIVVIGGLMVFYHWGLNVWLGDSADARSAFGDQYGALNVLITGVAFFGLMLSVAIQSKDLRSQTRALELQQEALKQQIVEFKEQREEMRRTADAQIQAANAQVEANRIAIFELEFERRKMRIESAIALAEASEASQRNRLLKLARDEALKIETELSWDQFSGPTKV